MMRHHYSNNRGTDRGLWIDTVVALWDGRQ